MCKTTQLITHVATDESQTQPAATSEKAKLASAPEGRRGQAEPVQRLLVSQTLKLLKCSGGPRLTDLQNQ